MNVGFDIKNSFFDRAAIVAMVGKQQAAFLNRAGGFIRTVSRRSMRPGGKKGLSSPAGQPPRYHSKDKIVTLRNIQYGYDRGSVIAGPIRLKQKQYIGGSLLSGTVPGLHEFGRTSGLREKKVGSQWMPIGRRKPLPEQPTRVRKVRYRKRPFMAPALDKARERFPQLWYGTSVAAA